jgi:hypothetical protein
MASFIFDEGRRACIGGTGTHSEIDLNDDILGVHFIDEGTDTPDQTNDQDHADRTGFNPTFANAPNLGSSGSRSTISSNVLVFDAADLAFTGGSVLTGSTSVESIELWKDTGTNTTSAFIANFDDYTGLPLTPSGGDVTIVWAATGILRF